MDDRILGSSMYIFFQGREVQVNIIIQILIRTTIFDVTSWTFTVANIGLALVIVIIVIILQFRISKEKVVLSY